MDGTFAVWMDLLKSRPEDEQQSAYHISVVGSIESPDQENETALAKGMDFSYLRDRGFINWDHQKGPENQIGEPTDVRILPIGSVPYYEVKPHQTGHEPCMLAKGVLYKGLARADATWQLMQTLAKSDNGYKRRLGASVEGGTLTRRGNVLQRTIVQHMALTHKPVHGDTIALAKSIGAGLPDAGADFAFANLTELTKALSPQAEPTLLETSRALVLGLVPCAARCHDGTAFRKGYEGMLEHLVNCAGWEPDVALQHVSALHKALR